MRFSDYDDSSTTSGCRPNPGDAVGHIGPWTMEGVVVDDEFGAICTVRCDTCGGIMVGFDPATPRKQEQETETR